MKKKERADRLNCSIVGVEELIDALEDRRSDSISDTFAIFKLKAFAFEKVVMGLEELVGQRVLECYVDRWFFIRAYLCKRTSKHQIFILML